MTDKAPDPAPQPKTTLDEATLTQIKAANLANVVRKVKAGKPLSKQEMATLEAAAGIQDDKRKPDGRFAPGNQSAVGYGHGGVGGKPKWHPSYIRIAREIAKHGLTDEEIAETFGVSEQTINKWKKKHPPFGLALKRAKEHPDKKVERSLFERALGYSHPDVDIRVVNGQIVKTPITKHYPPDTTACIYWTKNRQPEKWREKTEVIAQNPDGSALKAPVVHLILPAGRAAGIMDTEPPAITPPEPKKD